MGGGCASSQPRSLRSTLWPGLVCISVREERHHILILRTPNQARFPNFVLQYKWYFLDKGMVPEVLIESIERLSAQARECLLDVDMKISIVHKLRTEKTSALPLFSPHSCEVPFAY